MVRVTVQAEHRVEGRGVEEQAPVCTRHLDLLLSLQQGWPDTAAMVLLQTGQLLVTETVWRQYSYAIQNVLQVAGPEYRNQLEVQLAEPEAIRTLLTEADAEQRDVLHESAAASPGLSMAQQALLDIVTDALEHQASDIHLRMTGDHADIAYRIDGLLYRQGQRNRRLLTEAVAAALNTQSDDFRDLFDERQVAGASITLPLPPTHYWAGHQLRVRTQKSPCRGGFAVTLRLQRTEQQGVMSLAELGFGAGRVQELQTLMAQASGLILLSGPTGQGKTTTLAALNQLVPAGRKVVSLEDPIEIVQPRIEQKFVATDADPAAFAQMIRTVLREDPDLVEVSEIRDLPTAAAGISAALTGHLVLSTIHANDAVGIVARLLDLGVTPAQLSQPGLLQGLLAQRLLPRLCPHCREPMMHPQWGSGYQQCSSGCEHCAQRGVRGRLVVSELLQPDARACQYIRERNFQAWYERLEHDGWQSMARLSLPLVRAGEVALSQAVELVPGMVEILQQAAAEQSNVAGVA